MGYLKLDKELLNKGLTLKELGLIVKLLYVEDYREYKNEIEDGWFIKSKRELANELKTDVRRLNTIIDSLIEKGLVECEVVPDRYSKFKINRSQNDTTNRSQNDIGNRSQNDTLHNTNNNENNINKNINNNLDNNIINKNIYKEKENIKEKENSLDTGTSYKESEEQNIQPTVGNSYSSYSSINRDNSTIEDLVEDYLINHNGILDYTKDRNVNGFSLRNKNSIKEMNNLYGYLSIDDLNNMFVYLHKRN